MSGPTGSWEGIHHPTKGSALGRENRAGQDGTPTGWGSDPLRAPPAPNRVPAPLVPPAAAGPRLHPQLTTRDCGLALHQQSEVPVMVHGFPGWGTRWGRLGGSLLLQPGGLLSTRGLQLDVELLESLLQLLLVPSEVGRNGVVKEQELLVHHLDLGRAGVNTQPPSPTAQHLGTAGMGQDKVCPAQSCSSQLGGDHPLRVEGRSVAAHLLFPSQLPKNAP